MGKIRILLADDHAILRAGLRVLLNAQPDMEVIGEAEDGVQAIRKAAELKPDIVLMDISMPVIGGLEATKRIKKETPEVKVLALSMYDDEAYLKEILKAGGSGYILKKAADTELLSAIRTVYSGEMFLYPSMAKALVDSLLLKPSGSDRRGHKDDFDGLSERETEVLKLVAEGYTNQQIADKLVLSVKTVETYKSRVMEKLGLRGRAELVRYALRKGLLVQE